eukprot:gb/GEZJ01005509.1/.p2 GENE.gb/GEZJ01005509.1/~~gb/GEZJ01005509.1/.p2  ORF type:complete len:202 (+),score=18.58 gb/GEZJ01005509.1/:262-867(+)
MKRSYPGTRRSVNNYELQIQSTQPPPVPECNACNFEEELPLENPEEMIDVMDENLFIHDTRQDSNIIHVSSSRKRVAEDVFSFFDAYNDTSHPVFPHLKQPCPDQDNIHLSCQTLLQHCIGHQPTIDHTARKAQMVLDLKINLPKPLRHVTNQFQISTACGAYVDRIKKRSVQKEGWRTASILPAYRYNKTECSDLFCYSS